MHVITRRKLLQAGAIYPTAAVPLDYWYRACKGAHWKSIVDVRKDLPTADAAGEYTVFNIKGNTLRLITEINYRKQRVYLRHILTHAEYDKGAWK